MIGGVAVREVPDSMFAVNGTNASQVVDFDARDARRVEVVVALTTLVGIIQVSHFLILPTVLNITKSVESSHLLFLFLLRVKCVISDIKELII